MALLLLARGGGESTPPAADDPGAGALDAPAATVTTGTKPAPPLDPAAGAPELGAATGEVGGKPLAGKVICIDPGHAAGGDAGYEPIGPGAAETKIKDPGGTRGVVSGTPEHAITLAIAQRLARLLEQQGATVVMTRDTDSFQGGNIERVAVANDAAAALFVRIHCDGSTDHSRHGASTLYPQSIPGWTDDIHDASRAAAAAVQSALVAATGAADLGIVARGDITGFNWSDVPAILVEAGFLTNPGEDARLNTDSYQQQVAAGIAGGVVAWLGSG